MNFLNDIKGALETLRSGGVILYPTDTIWGLGCDATNPVAVEKIFKIKSRAQSKSLIILADSLAMVERYVREIPEIAFELTAVTDTPLTIIYPEGKNLAPGICNEDGSVAIRICKDSFCMDLISRFRKPIVATSANFSGNPAPEYYSQIDKDVINAAEYVVKYRQEESRKSTASSIIKLNANGTIKIIRK